MHILEKKVLKKKEYAGEGGIRQLSEKNLFLFLERCSTVLVSATKTAAHSNNQP